MAEGWQRLSVRRGREESDGPYEGLPGHLQHSVGEWLRGQFGWRDPNGMRDSRMAEIASACRIPVQKTYETGGISNQIFQTIEEDEDLYLDVLDATLYFVNGTGSATLDRILQTGGSVWKAVDSPPGLERRVSEAATTAFDHVTAPADSVAVELREAWGAVFGRNPNPSDGWDHAIKAVEDVLIPTVLPKAQKPNLGSVAGELKANPHLWSFGLPGNVGRDNGETLEGLLRHIWPNPDRHGGGDKRPPTQEEAEAAVHIAIAVVGLCRNRLVKR